MKKLISVILTAALLLGLACSASAVTTGDEKYNFYSHGYYSVTKEDYLGYLKKLCDERPTVYSDDELAEVYNRISYFMLNRNSIFSSDKALSSLLGYIKFVGLRNDDNFNCVEVIMENLNPKLAGLFSEYICDSDAVVLWSENYSSAPTYSEELNLKPARETAISLSAGQTLSVPVFNASGVQLWKTSNSAVLSVGDGKITARKKGSATVTAVYNTSVEISFRYKVTDNPRLTVGGKTVTSVSVKKGGTKAVRIVGKSPKFVNVYTNTPKAKVVSAPSAKVFKVKGLKKGSTIIKIKVNKAFTLKLKIKVK